jgi:hypothetical protein
MIDSAPYDSSLIGNEGTSAMKYNYRKSLIALGVTASIVLLVVATVYSAVHINAFINWALSGYELLPTTLLAIKIAFFIIIPIYICAGIE